MPVEDNPQVIEAHPSAELAVVTDPKRTAQSTLGEILSYMARIDARALAFALRCQADTGELLGDLLVRTGVIDKDVLGKALGFQERLRLAPTASAAMDVLSEIQAHGKAEAEDLMAELAFMTPPTDPGR